MVLLALPAQSAKAPDQGRDMAAMPADLKLAFENARYAVEPDGSGGQRANNEANGFSVQFSGAKTTIDAGSGAQTTLTLAGYGWGSALSSTGPITAIESVGKRLDRHYGSALTEWFLNTPEGLEQGFVMAQRPAGAVGSLSIRLAAAGGWSLRGEDDRIRLTKATVTLDYAGLRAWDAKGSLLPSRLRAASSNIEIEVDDARAIYPLTIDPVVTQALIQQQKLSVAGTRFFGDSVALSSDGNTALVGAPGPGAGSSLTDPPGAAYVFTRSGTSWSQQGPALHAATPMTGDAFGDSVALSGDGNTALIGADGIGIGSAYVFARSGTSWSQQGPALHAATPMTGDAFGHSVALSGDGNTALVGAVGAGAAFSLTGAAFVFARSGTMWNQQAMLNAPSPTAGDQFGASVALSSNGNTALVGAFGKNASLGAAYAFTRSGTSWSPTPAVLAEIASDMPAAGDLFGISVALSSDGNTALVGAQNKAAYVFTRSGTIWSQQGSGLTAAPAANGAGFAQSVALSSDANTALVGDFGNAVGAAYLFTRSGISWSQQKLTATDIPPLAASDEFGFWVALSSDGNTALVGAIGRNSQQGAAYVFVPSSVIDIGASLVNPLFTGPSGSCPTGWVCTGSPAPGFASYAPTTAQYTAGSPFATSAFSPTIFGGAGTIRQTTSLTWAAGANYVLNLWAGFPNTEPNGTTPVQGWAPTARVYLTTAAGAQVAAFDIPSPPGGSFAANPISLTLPANSPFIGQNIAVLIFVSAPSNFSANFDVTTSSISQ
jgi:hypothetical protein